MTIFKRKISNFTQKIKIADFAPYLTRKFFENLFLHNFSSVQLPLGFLCKKRCLRSDQNLKNHIILISLSPEIRATVKFLNGRNNRNKRISYGWASRSFWLRIGLTGYCRHGKIGKSVFARQIQCTVRKNFEEALKVKKSSAAEKFPIIGASSAIVCVSSRIKSIYI